MYPNTPLLTALVFVVLGLFFLERSSDWFVEGAAVLAKRFKVSPFIIGMVIIGFGTCAPEFIVSLMTGIGGKANLSLGNAYGSCIFNVAAILGIAAIIRPLSVRKNIVKIAAPALLVMTILSFFFLKDGTITRLEAVSLLLIFAIFFPIYCYYDRAPQPMAEVGGDPRAPRSLLAAAKLLFFGLLVMIGSSHFLVWGSVNLARALGVSELLIGLTIVAIGTSLPELATAIQSARKGQNEFILGNIIGSNIFNTLVVVGTASAFQGAAGYSKWVYLRDLPVLAFITLMISVLGKDGTITRKEGAFWLLIFIAYMILTVIQEAF